MLLQTLAIIFCTLFGAAFIAAATIFMMKRLEQKSSPTLTTATPQNDMLQATLLNLNDQLVRLHEKNNVAENQSTLAPKKSAENNIVIKPATLHTAEFVPYQYALKLLQEGADINVLRKQFNLSRGEIDVLQALHIKDTHLRHIDSQVL